QVARAREHVKVSEPDVRTLEQIEAAREVSRPDLSRDGKPKHVGYTRSFKQPLPAPGLESLYCKVCTPPTVRIADLSSFEASACATPSSAPSTGSCCLTGANYAGTTSSCCDGLRRKAAPPEGPGTGLRFVVSIGSSFYEERKCIAKEWFPSGSSSAPCCCCMAF